MAFYEDWTFWAVIVAATAIILSQIPPIHILVKSAKLDIELYSRIIVTHKVGNPNVRCHLILSNIGGRTLRIMGITITIIRDGKTVISLPGQLYQPDPNDSASLLLTKFILKPNDEWAATVNFLNYFSRSHEKKYKDAEAVLKKDIFEKREALADKKSLVYADSENVIPFNDFFDEMFIWTPGEYEMIVNVKLNKNISQQEKRYRFTLFESDSEELIKYKDVYNVGDGIFYETSDYRGIGVQITETFS